MKVSLVTLPQPMRVSEALDAIAAGDPYRLGTAQTVPLGSARRRPGSPRRRPPPSERQGVRSDSESTTTRPRHSAPCRKNCPPWRLTPGRSDHGRTTASNPNRARTGPHAAFRLLPGRAAGGDWRHQPPARAAPARHRLRAPRRERDQVFGQRPPVVAGLPDVSDAHRGRSFVLGDMPTRMDLGNNPLMWWEILQPHQPDAVAGLLCPEASEAANVTPKDAFHAWGPERFWDTPTKSAGRTSAVTGLTPGCTSRRMRTTGCRSTCGCRRSRATRCRWCSNCARLDIPVLDTDRRPSTASRRRTGRRRGRCAGRRWSDIKDGINVAFLDGHADRVSAAGLWVLKWSEQFTPRKVTIQR